MSDSLTRYIAVEGPMGVGKTSLARRLSESLGAELILEHAEQNPFLERFYRDPRAGALPAQLYFLFQRARLIQDMRQSDLFAPVRVADFLLDRDRLFASVALDAPLPDLVVYLQAPVDVLLERLARRAVVYEQLIRRDYLERLMDAYARFFHGYDRTPLLIVNAASIDLVHNEADYQQLFAHIGEISRGRHFFNPTSDVIA